MVWVYIALATVVLIGFFAFCAHLLKFRFALQWQSPVDLRVTTGVAFLWFHREFIFNGSLLGGLRYESGRSSGGKPADPIGSALARQGGYLRIPESLLRRVTNLRRRLYRALAKTALDLKVWWILLVYLSRSGWRIIRLLHPSMDYLHLGMQDVLMLGKFAAVWSSLSALFPSLACPVEYKFNERPGSLRVGLKGGFTGWNALVFGLMALVSFPWIPIAGRFLASWRNPRLNRWQRRLLLF